MPTKDEIEMAIDLLEELAEQNVEKWRETDCDHEITENECLIGVAISALQAPSKPGCEWIMKRTVDCFGDTHTDYFCKNCGIASDVEYPFCPKCGALMDCGRKLPVKGE